MVRKSEDVGQRMNRAWSNVSGIGSDVDRVAAWWTAMGRLRDLDTAAARTAFLVKNKVSAEDIKQGRKKLNAANRSNAQKKRYMKNKGEMDKEAASIPYHQDKSPGALMPPMIDPQEPATSMFLKIDKYFTRGFQMTYPADKLLDNQDMWKDDLMKFERDHHLKPIRRMIKVLIHFDRGTPIQFTFSNLNSFWGRLNDHLTSASLKGHGEPTFFTIRALVIDKPRGEGSRMTPKATSLKSALKKRGVITIHNPNDALCFDRSLAILLHQHWIREFPSKWKVLINHRCRLQEDKALEIRAKVGIPLDKAVDITEVPLYEDAFQVDIRVWGFTSFGAHQMYGPDQGHERRYKDKLPLNILLENIHYCPTLTIGSVLGHDYWDAELEQKARKPKACSQCKSESCEDKESPCADDHHCNHCNRRFRSDKCFDRHKSLTAGAGTNTRKKTTCESWYQCAPCGKTQERFDPSMATGPQWTKIDDYNYDFLAHSKAWPRRKHVHKCGYAHCKACNLYCDLQNHTCFIEKPTRAPKENGPLFFYDLETTADNEARRHIANYICVQAEDGTEFEFGNMTDFMAFATSRPKNSIFYAHNGGKFDTCFVLEHVLAFCVNTPRILKANGRILDLETEGILFRDTYPHVSAPLASFPKMFGLPGEKGYFPHGFNLQSTQDYVGPMPDIEFYCTDTMSVSKRQEVHEWHAAEVARGAVFDFRKEIAAYCSQDVTLLRLGILKYQEIVKNAIGYDPLVSLTIAAAGFDYFKREIMPADTIENISRDNKRLDSAEGREYIAWVEHQLGRTIKREYKIGNKIVDGYDPVTNTVYEYNGCLWHGGYGCDCNLNPHAVNPKNKMTFHELAERTKKREDFLRMENFVIKTQTSCKFKELRKTPEYKKFKALYDDVAPMTKRDALFGGRTDLGRMYWKAYDDCVAKYVDFCSLYPWVLKYCDLPLGPHTKIQGEDAHGMDVPAFLRTEKLGLFKLTVTCPDTLRFAVLPVVCKESGRLLFRCGQKTGVWTSVEIALALEMGYTIDKVHEAWVYESKGKIFRGYIDTFYKLKAQASKKPDWVKTDADLDEYIRQFEEKEGITLDKDKISENPGLRAVAKLYLNSSWGRLAMRDAHNMMQTRIISDPNDFFRTLDNPAYNWDASNLDFTGTPGAEKALFSLYDNEDLCDGSNPNTNPVMGAFVTSYARIKLYRLLNDVGHDNVLYMDTDSCIYVQTPDNAHVFKPTSEGGQLGDFLGELTDECDGQDIVEFVALAPKTYSYKLSNGDQEVKSKGLSLNWKSSQTICFDGYKAKLFDPQNTRLQIYFDSLRKARDAGNYQIFTKAENKEIRTLYTKGFVMADWSIRPFGHRDTLAHQ